MFWLVAVMVLLLLAPERRSTVSAAPMARQGCKPACGGLVVPFPFGMGRAGDNSCFMEGFEVTCDETVHPPQLFLGSVNTTNTSENVEVLHVDINGILQVNQNVARDCYGENGNRSMVSVSLDLGQGPYKFSDALNKFVAIGCDTIGYLVDNDKKFWSGCVSVCNDASYVVNETCSGIGCCQTNVPKGLRSFEAQLGSFYNHSYSFSYNPCSYAFLADDTFVFNASVFLNFTDTLPVKLEWAVGNKSCEEAKKNSSGDYACVDVHSVCENSTNGQGHRCNCGKGYQGNAYLDGGCEGQAELTSSG